MVLREVGVELAREVFMERDEWLDGGQAELQHLLEGEGQGQGLDEEQMQQRGRQGIYLGSGGQDRGEGEDRSDKCFTVWAPKSLIRIFAIGPGQHIYFWVFYPGTK